MALFGDHLHIHVHVNNGPDSDAIENLKTVIMGKLEELKAKMAVSEEKIDTLTAATEGVAQDVAFIKEKLAQSQDGIDAAGVAELETIVNRQEEKLTAAADKLKALDESTDSTGGETGEEGEGTTV